MKLSVFYAPFTKLFKTKEYKNMDNFSQEHLDKLLNRQSYLRQLIGSVNKKIPHRNWSVMHDFGAPLTIKAREAFIDDLIKVTIEVDFLTMFLKE